MKVGKVHVGAIAVLIEPGHVALDVRGVHPPHAEHANQRAGRVGLDGLVAGLQHRPVIVGGAAGQGVRPAAAPVAVPLFVADLEAVDISVPTLAVVAGGHDAGKAAHLVRPGKQIDAVADLGLAEARCILDRHGGVDASGVGTRDILVEPGEVVDPGGGFDGGPVPLQADPLDARGRDPILITPDGKPVGVEGGRIGPLRHRKRCEPEQAQQYCSAEDCGCTNDPPDGPSIHGTVLAQPGMKWRS